MTSLRKNLLLWLLPATFLAGVVASIGTYWGAYLELESILDDQLRYIAQHVNVTNQKNKIELGQLTTDQRTKDHEKGDEVLFEIWEGNLRVFSTHPLLKFSEPIKTGILDETYKGEMWHTFVTKKNNKWVRIGQAQNARFEALAGLSIHLFWPVMAMLPVLALFLWFGIGYGLRPLAQITQALTKRNAKSMSPILPTHPLVEIQPFVDALNDLLARLHNTFLQQEHFIADAAHELRTPVMGLQIEMDVLARGQDPIAKQASVIQLQTGIQRLSHLVQQLLTLATSESEHEPCRSEVIELTTLAKQVISDHALYASRKHIDLGLGASVRVDINGNQNDLKVVLDNLVDNAIRYVPEGGRIDVSVFRDQDCAVLEVSDNGAGIPENERDKVFQRFYRGKHQSISGSGLGLNIVKNIVDHQGAQLVLKEGLLGAGLCVQVRFPDITRLSEFELN